MNDQRITGTILLTIICTSLWGILLLSVYLGQTSTYLFLGIPIGIIFGIGAKRYVAKTWDPKQLRPTGYENRKAETIIAFVIIIGGATAKTFSDVSNGIILDLILGAMMSCVSYVLGWIVLQAHRHSPK